ncbi:MAG TPA: outer membrane beta-barrel protein [Longimicrobium sp.]|nr:outer membrane beta-barrel protein [Longimicrobium sp.]
MKKVIVGAFALAALVVGADRAAAQGTLPVTIEARIDAGIPVGDLGDAFEAGLGWGVFGGFDLTPNLMIYGGYSRFEFNDKDGLDIEAEDDGFELGGRVRLGTGAGVWTPFAQFGVLFHDDTGFEAGLGADYPVGNGVALTPMARFRKVGDIEYFGVGVGLSLRP